MGEVGRASVPVKDAMSVGAVAFIPAGAFVGEFASVSANTNTPPWSATSTTAVPSASRSGLPVNASPMLSVHPCDEDMIRRTRREGGNDGPSAARRPERKATRT